MSKFDRYAKNNILRYFLCSPKNFGGAYSRRLVRPSVSPSVRPSVSPSVRQIRVRPITLLFEVVFRNYFTEMTTMLRRRVAQHLGPYLEGQGHSTTLQQNHVRPITLLFEVRFRKYFTEMITILRRRVAYNIWVPTLKVKVTARPCSKIVSSQ